MEIVIVIVVILALGAIGYGASVLYRGNPDTLPLIEVEEPKQLDNQPTVDQTGLATRGRIKPKSKTAAVNRRRR